MPKKSKPVMHPLDDIDTLINEAHKMLCDISGKATPYTDYQDAVGALDRINEIKRIRSGAPIVDVEKYKQAVRIYVRALNCYERKVGMPGLKSSDFCNRADAYFPMKSEKDLTGWLEHSAFLKVDSLKRFIRNLTPQGYSDLVGDELIQGWFEEQNDDECDAENEFCSTPCWDEEIEDEESYERIDDDIDHIARGGFVIVSMPLPF